MCCEAVGQLEKVNNTSLKKHQNSTPDCRSVLSMGGDLAAHFGSEIISRRTDAMPARTIRSSLAAP